MENQNETADNVNYLVVVDAQTEQCAAVDPSSVIDFITP